MVEIELENLTKRFGETPVVKELNLTIYPGELLTLLGPSGCGKTTTLKLISGLLSPEEGDILFNQRSVVNIPPEDRKAVLVFQDYLLFPHMTVAENISFGLTMEGKDKKVRGKRVKELLELVNLKGYEDKYPSQLSGGEKQRIALARAVAINPEVLLMDEPLTNLDASLREEMQEFVRCLHEQEDMTTVFVTHDRQEAMLIADRIAVMQEGRIEQCASPEKLYKKPTNNFVADFLGPTNYLTGQIEKGMFTCKVGKLSIKDDLAAFDINLETEPKAKLLIRPEFIELSSQPTSDIKLNGIIKERKFVGERISYKVKVDNKLWKVSSLPPSSYQVGDEAYLSLDQQNIWVMKGE